MKSFLERKHSLFFREDRPTSASVTVELRSGCMWHFFCFYFLSLIYFLTLCLQEFLEYEPAVHVSLMVKAASQSCSRLGFIKDLRNEVYAAPVQFMTRLLLYMMTACLWMF